MSTPDLRGSGRGDATRVALPPPRAPRRGRIGALLALLGVVAAAAAAWLASDRVNWWLETPQVLGAEFPVVLDVPKGASAADVTRLLERERLLTGARPFRAFLHYSGYEGRLRAGEYSVERPLSPLGLAELLASGKVMLHAVTVPEGLTAQEAAVRLAESGLWSESDLVTAFRDPAPIRDLDAAAPDLEGYLFPETYNVPRGTSAASLADAMVARFRAVWTGLGGDEEAARLGWSVRQVVTLASLVEKETGVASEYPLVSSVYHNRLASGMLLECDPTVIHAMKLLGTWTGGPLLLTDLRCASPYNTYVTPGLPPGPIASPGREAIKAALDPAVTRYVFFVATGDGGHRFAETLAEHQRNVARYRQWQREERAR